MNYLFAAPKIHGTICNVLPGMTPLPSSNHSSAGPSLAPAPPLLPQKGSASLILSCVGLAHGRARVRTHDPVPPGTTLSSVANCDWCPGPGPALPAVYLPIPPRPQDQVIHVASPTTPTPSHTNSSAGSPPSLVLNTAENKTRHHRSHKAILRLTCAPHACTCRAGVKSGAAGRAGGGPCGEGAVAPGPPSRERRVSHENPGRAPPLPRAHDPHRMLLEPFLVQKRFEYSSNGPPCHAAPCIL
jgi:hypothetical protein